MNLTCVRRCIYCQHLPALGHVVPFRQQRRSVISGTGHPYTRKSASSTEEQSHEDYSQLPWAKHFGPLTEKPSTGRKWADDVFKPYIPYAKPFLHGLWEINNESTLLIVDDLATVGCTQRDSIDDNFANFQPVVESDSYEDALRLLNGRENVSKYGADDIATEEGDITEDSKTPLWMITFILATMTNSRGAAMDCLLFCFNRLDTIPDEFKLSLLVLCMCSLIRHKILFQIPLLLRVFSDCTTRILEESSGKIRRTNQADTTPGEARMRHLVLDYQCNALLLLLAKSPYYPAFPKVINDFLEKTKQAKIRLEVDTVKKLCDSKFATKELVIRLGAILHTQDTDQRPVPSDMILTLTNFYTRGRSSSHLIKAAEQFERTMQINVSKHLKYYVRTFKDALAALDYLNSLNDRTSDSVIIPSHLDNLKRTPLSKELDVAFPAHSRPISSRPVYQRSLEDLTKEEARHVFFSLIQSAAFSFKTISADTLYSMFDNVRETHGDSKYLETMVLRGLILRRAWDYASRVWNDWQTAVQILESYIKHIKHSKPEAKGLYDGKWTVHESLFWTTHSEEDSVYQKLENLRVDDIGLARGLQTIVAMNPKNLLEAFTAMDSYAIKSKNSTSPQSEKNSSTIPYTKKKIQLTPYVINVFMTLLLQHRRPDIVFHLWENMTSYYLCEHNLGSFVLLIRAARMTESLELGMVHFIPNWLRGDGYLHLPPKFQTLSEEIKSMLAPGYTPTLLWHGEYPWRIVRHIFRDELILKNWPELRFVEIPGCPRDEDRQPRGFHGFLEVRAQRRLTNSRPMIHHPFPHIMPNQATFRQYIFMLGTVRRTEEIPELLAWMKALNTTPTRQTLAIALAYWLEVDQKFKPDTPEVVEYVMSEGGYGILARWIRDWLGGAYVPKREDIASACKQIQRVHKNEQNLY